jgi:hypothetical protein
MSVITEEDEMFFQEKRDHDGKIEIEPYYKILPY